MKVMFIFAHPDDEAFGPAGTIAKHVKLGDDVTVVALCKGNRPGNETVAIGRQDSFAEVCKILGAKSILLDSSDGFLEYQKAVADVSEVVADIQPDTVYTHNISDIHIDHRTVSEATMVACRPKLGSSVKSLIMCEIPASTEWSFGQIEPAFVPNLFVDVTDYINMKEQAMTWYTTDTYEYPDARSFCSMKAIAANRGKQVGVKYAEAFKIVFQKS